MSTITDIQAADPLRAEACGYRPVCETETFEETEPMNRVWGNALVIAGLLLMLGGTPSWGRHRTMMRVTRRETPPVGRARWCTRPRAASTPPAGTRRS